MDNNSSATSANRVLALDALRGLAILAMLLSGQLPFGGNDLPSWMYHAQEPPPTHEWIGTLPGITWVDLVFPFFLFSMGAAFPFALSRRLKEGVPTWRAVLFVLERGFLLGFFALFVQAIRPSTLSHHPTAGTWFLALLGFVILFPVLTRLPSTCPRAVHWSIRLAGWTGVILFFALARYPDGSGFKLERSDIIIVVLTNMAVFGSLVWMLTRDHLLPRLGVLGILFAIRLSNMPQPVDGWVHDVWQFSPAPWIYQLYYLQYLCIVIPGTIAGDLFLKWARETATVGPAKDQWPTWRKITICILMFFFVTSGLAICVLIGLSIIIDVFKRRRWLQLLIDNGQNPMIAYAGINNFITPLLALTGGDYLLTQFASTPWRGFGKGLLITLLMAVTVSFLTRRKIFWRT